MATRQCAAHGCYKQFTGNANRKYCSTQCKERTNKAAYRDRKKVAVLAPQRVRRGDVYATLESSPALVDALAGGAVSATAAAEAIGVGRTTFDHAYATFLAEGAARIAADAWVRDPTYDEWLATGDFDYTETQDLDEWLDRATEGFVSFREHFFSTPRGPYYTKEFHRAWIRGILHAIVTGGRQLILSPPRHGKSELLVHFAVWLIARDPSFRIIWIGGNSDIASDMVGAVKQHLESDEELRTALIGPAQWRPLGRRATTWGATKFTVANRSQVAKAPTMRSVGRQGKILSMDVDLIICDDIEDFDSTVNETERGKTRSWWFNTVESRKEEHTAWVTIGSRQHPDDLYDYLLGDSEWEAIVNSAHDPVCGKDPATEEDHDSCMLFPELRSYRWLAGKRRTAEAQGLLANYEMVYLNDPRPPGMTVFSETSIEASKNWGRRVGLAGLDHDKGYHLVAGLDPSATGFQAALLWAYVKSENRLYGVDIDNRRGGGVYEAFALFRDWDERYGVKHWVVEENGFQRAIGENREVREWANREGVYLEPHQTQGGNKHDNVYGVGAMAHLYDSGLVDLPWGDEESREKFGLLISQMRRFVDRAAVMRRGNRLSDVLMASWFPMKAIRRFQKEAQARASVPDEFSFTGWDTSTFNEVPW